MKAAVVEKPGLLSVWDIPEPQAGEYGALCELLYGATCTGTDQHIIYDRCPWQTLYPTVLGHESIGRVVAVGAKVRHLKPGDLVTRVGTPPSATGEFHCSWGGFAEKGVAFDHWAMREDGLPAEQWQGHTVNQVLPPGTDPRGATMIITWRETLSFITRLGIGRGARVLIVGSGGNALSFASHARNVGASFVAVAGSAARASAAKAAGANAYADYKAADAADCLGRACGDGYDFLIDAVGKAGQIDRFLSLVKSGGIVTVYGIDEFHNYAINPRKARGNFTYVQCGYSEAETHDRVLQFMQDGQLDASIWLDLEHPFPLAEINKAFDAVRTRKLIKALVKLSAG